MRKMTVDDLNNDRIPYNKYDLAKMKLGGDPLVIKVPRDKEVREAILEKVRLTVDALFVRKAKMAINAFEKKDPEERKFVAVSSREGVVVWRVR